MLICEKRYLGRSDLASLIAEHGWFTEGDNEEYNKLLKMTCNRDGSSRNISTKLLQDIASRIVQYSAAGSTDILGITGVMFCIAERCITCFTEAQFAQAELRDWNRSADIAARITEAAQKEKQENLRRKEK